MQALRDKNGMTLIESAEPITYSELQKAWRTMTPDCFWADAEKQYTVGPTDVELVQIALAIAAKEELALDQISKKSYTEIETYIRTTVTNLDTAKDLLVKMGKLLKALVDR